MYSYKAGKFGVARAERRGGGAQGVGTRWVSVTIPDSETPTLHKTLVKGKRFPIRPSFSSTHSRMYILATCSEVHYSPVLVAFTATDVLWHCIKQWIQTLTAEQWKMECVGR